MYPLYWTPSKGGITMRYSYEFKREAIELYREGKWPETPEGIKSPKNFHEMIRRWARMEEDNDTDVLRHKGQNKKWRPEEKLELIQQVLAGRPNQSVAIEAGISSGMLYQWVSKYKKYGYNGLVNRPKGRKPKEPIMKKKVDPAPLTESEREELIRLRARTAYLEAEIEVIKKEIALRHAKWDEELKAKKQRSSRNSGKKDTN